jgi:hypothetical protein
MNQKWTGVYLNRKGWMTQAFHDDLVATLDEEAMAHGTMTEYLREAQTGSDDSTALFDEGSRHMDD